MSYTWQRLAYELRRLNPKWRIIQKKNSTLFSTSLHRLAQSKALFNSPTTVCMSLAANSQIPAKFI